MSWSGRKWAWEYGTRLEKPEQHRPLRPATKLVLAALGQMENDRKGCAWPSMATIAEMTGLATRSVQDQVQELEVRGLIVVRRPVERRKPDGKWAGYSYRLRVPEWYRDQDRTWTANLAAGQDWGPGDADETWEEVDEPEGAMRF